MASCRGESGSEPVNAQTAAGLRTLGAHGINFQRMSSDQARISVSLEPRSAPGGAHGLVLISVGRGDIHGFGAPVVVGSGSAANQLGAPHSYSKYPQSGTALYGIEAAHDEAAHEIATDTPPGDEITLAAVQLSRTTISAVSWREAFPGKVIGRNSVRSATVRTTGPATLVAFWWGDAGVQGEKTAVPGDGFVLLDSVLGAGALVQCAVAVKEVADAGEYDVTWTATPRQAAQLWLIAVQ